MCPPPFPSSTMSVAPSPPTQRQARSRYQRGMLAWLQVPGDPAGLPEMRAALRTMEARGEGDFINFWRTAETYLRAISDGTLAVDAESRRLCARIDLQMRAALGGAVLPEEGLADELRQRILKGAGQLPPVAELISLRPADEAPPLDAAAVSAWQAASTRLAVAWPERGSAGIGDFRQGLIDLCGAAIALNLPEALHLAEALAGVGDLLDDPAMAEVPVVRAAVAAALEIVGDVEALGLPLFAQRVAHVVQRLEQCREAEQPPVSPTLLRLFAVEIREQTGLMREELACLAPDAGVLVAGALELADHAGHLELEAPQQLAAALARAAERAAAGAMGMAGSVEAGEGLDHPEVRELLEMALAELETMADFMAAERLPLASDDILHMLAQD